MAHYDVEWTDTFGGEANYSWVRRAVIEHTDFALYHDSKKGNDQRRQIMRKAKRAVGITGLRGRTHECGGGVIEFRPYRMCAVMFVTWRDTSLYPVEES